MSGTWWRAVNRTESDLRNLAGVARRALGSSGNITAAKVRGDIKRKRQRATTVDRQLNGDDDNDGR